MKRFYLATLVALVVFAGLVGCSKKDESGTFDKEREVTQADIKIFNEALGEEASSFKPLKVSTQVVSGTNYKFYVEDLSSKDSKHWYITIYVSLDAKEAPKVIERTEAK